MDDRFKIPYSHPRFWWEGDYIPTCFTCIHFRGAYRGKIRCEAFPGGIPKGFIDEEEIHNHPYPGDHGIRFERYIDNETV